MTVTPTEMQSTQVTFQLAGTEDEWPFLRTYLVSAWERFENSDAFESGWFWPAGNFAQHDTEKLRREKHDLEQLERGQVILVLNGDPERLIESERSRWEALQTDGPLTGYECRSFDPAYQNARDKMQEKYGDVGGERVYKLRCLVADFTIDYLDRFESQLPAIGTETEENPAPVGFWSLIHFMMKQQGYDWDDEIAACAKDIENRLQSLALFRGEEAAQEKRTAVLERLENTDIDV